MKKIEENIFEIEKEDVLSFFPHRSLESNKGDFGIVGIMGGCLNYSGSVKLANMSAASLRSGCGVVRVIVPDQITSAVSPYLLEQTLYPLPSDSIGHIKFVKEELTAAISKLDALAFGMGLGNGSDNEKILAFLLEHFTGNLLIDADGLNTLSMMDQNILLKAQGKVILTPHLKEFSRLIKLDIEEIKKKPIELACRYAKKYHVILLLKGHTTIVTDGNIVYLVTSGCPGMATAGSGDVLSGIIIGMAYHKVTALSVACSSYLAGLAGSMAEKENTDIAMIASDTVKSLPLAIKSIRNEQ